MTKYDSFMKYQVIKDDNWEKNRANLAQGYDTEKTEVSLKSKYKLSQNQGKSLFSQVCFAIALVNSPVQPL
ncbi:hypothetical protein [Pseudoalteromonas sp. OOF1S-7]|uniref:hypothetical protein n=1 Tax=Pseudoalteromonas sp. OOF1S-7 TaxID=2917757 RepID=UPI001EF52267|nr:hypothetical protein [Pseudoalteromonas sp. OOF1S-7]MCG7536247.1 hypothetical protein [Pseudoalteromonas sp. OOF1S-7]